jgi:CheY-like chemotaxis protein
VGRLPRILILDDEPMISSILQDWLAELRCETVGPAQSVQAALGLVESTSVDAGILDVTLRGEDCYPVAEALRSRSIPFVLTTGYGSGGVLARFRDRPILSKPFNFEALRGAIATLLGA